MTNHANNRHLDVITGQQDANDLFEISKIEREKYTYRIKEPTLSSN